MAKNKIIIVIVALLLIVFSLMYFTKTKSIPFIELNFYDSNGNLITKTASVVGGVEGVKFVSLKINIKNLDSVPLSFEITELSPVSISSAKPTNTITVQPNALGSFKTSLIDIQQFEGTNQTFCVKVKSLLLPALRAENVKEGCISVSIFPDPVGTFTVDISLGETEGANINPSCIEDWSCTSWSACTNAQQSRTCNDLNNCGTTNTKPLETQSCTLQLVTSPYFNQEMSATSDGSWSQQNLPPSSGGDLRVTSAYDESFTTSAVTYNFNTVSNIIEYTDLSSLGSVSFNTLEFHVKGGGNVNGATISYSVWNYATSSWDLMEQYNNNGVLAVNNLIVNANNHISNGIVRLRTQTYSGSGEVWVFESEVRASYYA